VGVKPNTSKVGDLESSGTPECLELNNKAQNDGLLGPGVNPLEGSPNVKLRKLGSKGTLPASNSREG
jgi:hypothetical protein